MSVTRALLLSALIALLHGPLLAQSSAVQGPAFEVATIKAVDSSSKGTHPVGTKVYPGGRIRLSGFTLKGLICTAFHVSFFQVAGGPDWIKEDAYDVEAKAPEAIPAVDYDLRHTNRGIEDPDLRQMLQALLVDRFKLKFHREGSAGIVYLLERTAKPLRLTLSEQKYAKEYGQGFSGDIGHAGDTWVLYNTSMAQLADFASMFRSHPVLDKTGLAGSFDAKWTQTLTDPQAYDGMDSFPLFLESMGLKLTKTSGPVESFIIDSVERPTAN